MREHTRRWLPFAAAAALLLGALAAVTMAVAGAGGTLGSDGRFDLDALLAAGLKDDALVAAGRFALLVRAGAVHASWSHLIVNAIAFLLIGILYWRLLSPARRDLGSAWVMLALVTTSSSAGFALSFIVRNGLSCGASAGIYGLFAAIAGATWVHRAALPERLRLAMPLTLTLISLGAVVVLLGRPGLDHAAHLGGWATGLPLGMAVQHRAGRVAVAVLGAGLVLSAVLFY